MSDEPDAEKLRQEILDGLQLPEDGLRQWLHDDKAFCNAHGGRRIYGELLDLLDRFEAALNRRRKTT